MIRELFYEDFPFASDVLWKSFYFAEKNNHSICGMERFRDLTSPVSLSLNTFDGSILLYGAFVEEKLVAVGAIKDKNHILLLYVLPEFQKQGIGKELLAYMEDRCKKNEITLNSSDFAIDFYTLKWYYKVYN